MNDENINIAPIKPRILVAPLDWGLGHATRIIPLVKLLESHGAELLLAADGVSRNLLQAELPGREILTLQGYNIRYGKNNKTFFIKLLLQIPAVLRIIKKEHRWLQNVVAEKRIDAVISDNRFGLYSKKIPSVFITHQLYIETGNRFFNALAQKINFSYIQKFSLCWVPDWHQNGLAGKLSHPASLPNIPVKYLGPLSRFTKNEAGDGEHLLIILSGPEPMRSIWEEQLLEQLKMYNGNAVLVRGLPLNNKTGLNTAANVQVYNYLPSAELTNEIKKAGIVLCRSGYSSVMDLLALNKQAVLVPTPGQGEQQYLGEYLMEQGLFYSCSQQQFNLQAALQAAQQFSFKNINANFETTNLQVILPWLLELKKTIAAQ